MGLRGNPGRRPRETLGRLALHLIGIGGVHAGTYARHGYDKAMRTQIDYSIFDYCSAKVVTSKSLYGIEDEKAASHIGTAKALGRNVFA